MKHIRIASEADKDQITDLRLTEYSKSKDFLLINAAFLKWDEIDNDHPVIGVWNEKNQVIATMLPAFVDNQQKAVDIIEYDLPIKVSFPALIFCRAATKASHRMMGFNQLLRYYYLTAALKHNIKSLLSPVFKKATRTKFMDQIGYKFYTPLKTSGAKLLPVNERQLAVLERSGMKNAAKIIEKTIPNLIKEYPWKGKSITF
ncbi:MAG: hypothetical protein KAR45_20795 [Desulfobacteraceae bacterium]|nr:hypothetical protein [Desulfobacteraceae bacterium]